MLLRGLNHLSHKLSETLVISEDGGWAAEKVLPPFTNLGGNGVKLPHICGRIQQTGIEVLTKER